jgi:hypothetical protein
MKDAGMRIRVEPELRDKFVNLCRDNDVPAAQVLRSFMREYVRKNVISPTELPPASLYPNGAFLSL